MSLHFRIGKSSALFAHTVLAKAAAKKGIALGQSKDWREHYQEVFAQLAAVEALDEQAVLQRQILDSVHEEIRDDSDRSLKELVATGFLAAGSSSTQLKLDSAIGNGEPSPLATIGTATAENLINHQLAEAGLLADLTSYDRMVTDDCLDIELANTVFVAIGANAELALTEELLALGANVVAIARPNQEKWQRLIEFAAASAGTLNYPSLEGRVGLALDTEIELIAEYLGRVLYAHPGKRIVCLGFVYAPGSAQIIASAAQDALMSALAEQVGIERFVAGWLATPLDSYLVKKDLLDSQQHDFSHRNFLVRLRDAIFGLSRARADSALKGVKSAQAIESELTRRSATVLDFSARRQGSSYLLAKRIERWRAAELVSRGYQVWFQVTPAARTNSTLGYKFVRAAYRGLARLGVVTFEAWMLRDLLTACLLGRLGSKKDVGSGADSGFEGFAATAIHGKLWRLPYRLEAVWRTSFLMGLDEYLHR